MNQVYQISDGKLTLELRPAGKGWYAVTCPLDPQLMTQARSVEEAFEMAHDARKALIKARAKLIRRLAEVVPTGRSDSKVGMGRTSRELKGTSAPSPAVTAIGRQRTKAPADVKKT